MGNQPAALITGASSGIGLELAKVFARHGHDLVLVARNKQKLDELGLELGGGHGVFVKTIQKDLSDSHAPEEIYDLLKRDWINVGIVVNNAGFATYGLFNEIEMKPELEMLHVNIIALTHLTKLFLKDMVKEGTGRILNVASTAAFQPGPLMAAYYASKAYVLHFSEAISNEVKGSGVTVSVLCPGSTATGFQKRADMEESRLIAGKNIMSARTVAEYGYKGLMAGKTIIIPWWGSKVVVQLNRLVPRSFAVRAIRAIQERRK